MELKELYFTAPQVTEVRRSEISVPAPGKVLVSTITSAISPGTEMLVYRGQLPTDLAADETISALSGTMSFPLKYGYCAVGKVVDVGTGVTPDIMHQRVFAFQPHQSHFESDPQDLLLLPEDLALDDAVFLPNTETAVSFVMDAAPLIGERVAVVGQGIVGLLTTSILAQFPLANLITLDWFPKRRSASLEAGAQASYAPDQLPESLLQSFDLVFELSGFPGALETAINLAGPEARVVVGSWYGNKQEPISFGGHFHRGRLKILSSQVSKLAPHLSARWTKSRRLQVALNAVNEIQPAKFITNRFDISEASKAYALIDHTPEETIQVVFDYV